MKREDAMEKVVDALRARGFSSGNDGAVAGRVFAELETLGLVKFDPLVPPLTITIFRGRSDFGPVTVKIEELDKLLQTAGFRVAPALKPIFSGPMGCYEGDIPVSPAPASQAFEGSYPDTPEIRARLGIDPDAAADYNAHMNERYGAKAETLDAILEALVDTRHLRLKDAGAAIIEKLRYRGFRIVRA